MNRALRTGLIAIGLVTLAAAGLWLATRTGENTSQREPTDSTRGPNVDSSTSDSRERSDTPISELTARDLRPAERSDTETRRSRIDGSNPGGSSRVAGVVVDPTGRPVQGATVRLGAPRSAMQLVRGLESRSLRRGAFSASTTSERDGSFEVEVPDGEIFGIRAFEDDFAPSAFANVAAGAADLRLELQIGGIIEGRVVDEQRQPIPGATVELSCESETRRMTTDPEGAFAFAGVPVEPLRMKPSARGYIAVESPEWRFPEDARLDGVELVLALERQAFGFVFDPEGQPIAGASAIVASLAGLERSKPVRSDAEGQFRITGLRGGVRYQGTIETRGYAALSIDPFEVTPDGVAHDLGTFVTRRGASVRGSVRDESGSPVADALVSAERDGTELASAARTSATGVFGIRFLEPGPVTLVVRSNGHVPHRTDPIELVDESDHEVAITLRTGANLEGNVADAAGAPVEHVMIAALSERDPEPVARVFTDAAGEYRLGGLDETAVYRIEAFRRGTGRAVVADVPGDTGRLDILLEGRGRFTGTVTNSAKRSPVEEFLLALEPLDAAPRTGDAYHIVDRAGRFDLDDLEPGPYRVLVRADGFGVTTIDRIVIPGGEALEQRIEMRPAARIVGRVLDSSGRPVVGATVEPGLAGAAASSGYTLRSSDLPTISPRRPIATIRPSATTDGHGIFRLEGLDRGRVHLLVRHPAFDYPTMRTVDVPAGGDVTLGDLTLGGS